MTLLNANVFLFETKRRQTYALTMQKVRKHARTSSSIEFEGPVEHPSMRCSILCPCSFSHFSTKHFKKNCHLKMLLKTWLLCYLIQVSLGTGSVKMTNSEILVLKDESQDLREKLALLKSQVDEMFEEIKNQNHAVFKQSDHSRILSGKVSNMSKEIKLLKEENSILRDRLELHEFKTGKRFKKVKQKLDILAEGLGEFSLIMYDQ